MWRRARSTASAGTSGPAPQAGSAELCTLRREGHRDESAETGDPNKDHHHASAQKRKRFEEK